MMSDVTQALEVIGLIALTCTIVSPLLLWLLSYHQTETT